MSLPATVCLANAGIPGLSYASNEHHTRQENVKTQVNQHMPAFHADPDHTVMVYVADYDHQEAH